MQVRILRPAKTAMQSGQARTKEWVIQAEPAPKLIDPLMGWTGSRDTMQQVRLSFDTLEEAKAYAEKMGWRYTVEQPHARHVRPKAYADNFAYNRVGRWTH
ncbi:MAG: ETC complex I subunit [Reyranellaceae bacterium]